MNFKKENLKEVVTTDKVTDILIFEKGSSEPKKIKKTNFNGGLPYKSYIALLSQSDTNAPVATILQNDLGDTPTWNYIQEGTYTMTLSNAFNLSKTVAFVSTSSYGSNGGFIAGVSVVNSSTIGLETNASGNPLNDLITKLAIEIRVYS